jgi:hypothetical protein
MVLRSTFDSIRVPAEYAISKEYEGKESIQKCLVEFDGAEEEYGIDIAGKFPVHHLMPLLFYVPAVLARESLVLECSLSRGNRIAASDHVFRYGVDNRGRRNAVQARIRNGNAQLLLEAPSANGPEIFARVIRFLFIDELRDRAEIKSIRLSRAG